MTNKIDPDHYRNFHVGDEKYEAIQIIEAFVDRWEEAGVSANAVVDLALALQYMCRLGQKPSEPASDDIGKIEWYVKRARPHQKAREEIHRQTRMVLGGE